MTTFDVIHLPTCQRINVHSLTLLARGTICGQFGGVEDEGALEHVRAGGRWAPLADCVCVVLVDQSRAFVGPGWRPVGVERVRSAKRSGAAGFGRARVDDRA